MLEEIRPWSVSLPFLKPFLSLNALTHQQHKDDKMSILLPPSPSQIFWRDFAIKLGYSIRASWMKKKMDS